MNVLGLNSVIYLDVSWYMVLFMVLPVYVYVWNFHSWYMGGEVGLLGFSYTYLVFIMGMLLYLAGGNIVIVLSWESIGLISMLLIGYWFRGEAYGSSYAAVLYNRLGDVSIMYILLNLDTGLTWIFVSMAILSKSALWVCGYWLPIAMEGPTPVSSLLHSSTMVVAGVFLMIMYIEYSLLIPLVSVVIMSLYLSGWYDSKKMIALSTSVHLVVMIMCGATGLYGIVVFHIVTHSLVNASAFVNSGWYIHIDSGQDLRSWGIMLPIFIMAMAFIILCGIGSSLVSASKEYIILSWIGVVVIVMSWGYSNNFLNNIDGVNNKAILDSGFLPLMFVMGGLSFISLDVVIVSLVIICMRIVNIGNIYILNN